MKGLSLAWDYETGLDYRGARFYDSDIARFLSLDPLAADFADMSPYNYVAGNPIYFTDPTGLAPECEDCPDETYVPIADHVYGAEVGDVTSNGWKVLNVDLKKSGFRGALYEGTHNGETEYIYATAGTEDGTDASENIEQLFGNAEQYGESVDIAEGLSESYSGVSFTGHSLGGGLASANALATEGKAVTFNAAALSEKTKSNLNLNNKTADITAYIVTGEIVDYGQRQIGMSAEGQRKVYLPATGGNRVNNHKMKAVIDGFKIYQDIMKTPIKTFNY